MKSTNWNLKDKKFLIWIISRWKRKNWSLMKSRITSTDINHGTMDLKETIITVVSGEMLITELFQSILQAKNVTPSPPKWSPTSLKKEKTKTLTNQMASSSSTKLEQNKQAMKFFQLISVWKEPMLITTSRNISMRHSATWMCWTKAV